MKIEVTDNKFGAILGFIFMGIGMIANNTPVFVMGILWLMEIKD